MDTTEQQAVTVAQEDRDLLASIIRVAGFSSEADELQQGGSEGNAAQWGGELEAIARHRLASVSSASADYVMVPREPTEAMLKAGQAAADDKRWKWCGFGPRKPGEGLDGMLFYVRDAFAAMLAASPEPVPATNQAGEVDVEKIVRRSADQILNGFSWETLTGPDNLRARLSMAARQAVHDTLAALATQPATSQEGEGDALTRRVSDVMNEDGGCWAACSGCQESDEGYVSEKYYPYSPIFHCQPGGGCSECGGIGVIWQDGAFLASYGDALSEDATPTPPTLSEDLREALKPFANAAADYDYADGQPAFDDYPDASSLPEINDLTVGNLRAARAARARTQVKAS